MRKKKEKRKSRQTISSHKRSALSPEQEKKIARQVFSLAEPLCEAEGIELVYVEYQKEARGRILRVYIDKPGGVKLDNCVNISRQLGDILDVSLEKSGAYSLEVSSPGPDRPLGKQADFIRFRGNKVKIKTSQPVDGKNSFRGTLEGIVDDVVSITTHDGLVSIPFCNIFRARLVDDNGENRC